jgi:hypothetical protein
MNEHTNPLYTADDIHQLHTTEHHHRHTARNRRRIRTTAMSLTVAAGAVTGLTSALLIITALWGPSDHYPPHTLRTIVIGGAATSIVTYSTYRYAAASATHHQQQHTVAESALRQFAHALSSDRRHEPNSRSDLTQLEHLLTDITASHPATELRTWLHRETLRRYGMIGWWPDIHTAASTVINDTGISNVLAVARWWPLSGHAAGDVLTPGTFNWARNSYRWFSRTPLGDGDDDYIHITRTTGQHLLNTERHYGTNVLTIAQQLAADDPDHQHTFTDLIATAAALTHTPNTTHATGAPAAPHTSSTQPQPHAHT